MSRACLIASLAVLLACSSSEAAQKAKKKGGVKGSVVEIKKEKDKEEGTITIQVTAKKKKAAAGAGEAEKPEKKTYKVTSQTKVEKMVGKKKEAKAEEDKFSNIKEGFNVTITAEGDVAQKITFVEKKAKKKKKPQ